MSDPITHAVEALREMTRWGQQDWWSADIFAEDIAACEAALAELEKWEAHQANARNDGHGWMAFAPPITALRHYGPAILLVRREEER